MNVIEKRKFPRIYRNLNTVLTNNNELNHKVICRNISEGGVCLEVDLMSADEKALWAIRSKETKVDIEISLINDKDKVKAAAVVKWEKEESFTEAKKLNLGMEFVEIDSRIRNRLASFITDNLPKGKTILPGIKEFTLLVNEEETDTGRYEYYPYADKMVLDPAGTIKRLRQLSNGEVPADYKDYIYARYCIGDSILNQKAIESAYAASKEFKRLDLLKRKKILNDIYNLLLTERNQLVEILVAEGHPRKLAEWEVSGMETGLDPITVDFYTSELCKEIKISDKEFVRIVRKPDGVVCLCPPRNASASNSGVATMAFLSGNAVVIKPPLRTPLSAIYFWKNVVWKALRVNNAPKGSLNIVIGNSNKIMSEWLESPYVNDIIYFGNSNKGLEIGSKCWEKNKKAVLELSGNDMLLVWKDTDIDKAVLALLDGFLGSTQICMVPKKALVHQEIYQGFLDKFTEEVKKN